MKTLYESLLDDEEDLINDDTVLIQHYLFGNYYIQGNYTIKNNIVNVNGSIVFKGKDNHLTNGLFEFGEVTKDFSCSQSNIVSLEGSPKKVKNFYCTNCNNLKSLKGGPKKVSNYFTCTSCKNLETLKGSPEEVDYFNCNGCIKLKNLEGSPKKIGWDFSCSRCSGLISLKGAPDYVGNDFLCTMCSKLISIKDVPKTIKGYTDFYKCDNIQESLLDDEEDLIMGDEIINNLVFPEYIKKQGENLIYLKLEETEELFNSGEIKGLGFSSSNVVTGIGFAINNRKRFPSVLTKNYTGWGISIFKFGKTFERTKNTGNTERTDLIPLIFNKKMEEISNKYQYISDLSFPKLKERCNQMFVKLKYDKKLLKDICDYIYDRNYEFHKESINNLLK